ncbi:MAG: hypothetical protein SFY81_14220 [Verrucomicrobiota bacterium]|nr:hypothetical protein [Verrucomicrobiota bacterium]
MAAIGKMPDWAVGGSDFNRLERAFKGAEMTRKANPGKGSYVSNRCPSVSNRLSLYNLVEVFFEGGRREFLLVVEFVALEGGAAEFGEDGGGGVEFLEVVERFGCEVEELFHEDGGGEAFGLGLGCGGEDGLAEGLEAAAFVELEGVFAVEAGEGGAGELFAKADGGGLGGEFDDVAVGVLFEPLEEDLFFGGGEAD